MRFSELIFEMAFHQDKAIEKIEGLLPQLSEHILKCWIMKDSIDRNHWITEISNWLRQIDSFSDIKTRRGRISLEVFKKEFKNKLADNRINNYIKAIEIEYDISVQNKLKYIRKLQAFLESFFISLSQDSFDLVEMINKVKN